MPAAVYDDVPLPALLLVGDRTARYLRASVEHLAAMLPAAHHRARWPGPLAAQFAPELFCTEVLRFIDVTGKR